MWISSGANGKISPSPVLKDALLPFGRVGGGATRQANEASQSISTAENIIQYNFLLGKRATRQFDPGRLHDS